MLKLIVKTIKKDFLYRQNEVHTFTKYLKCTLKSTPFKLGEYVVISYIYFISNVFKTMLFYVFIHVLLGFNSSLTFLKLCVFFVLELIKSIISHQSSEEVCNVNTKVLIEKNVPEQESPHLQQLIGKN